jgi:hypothetical protein
MRAGLVAVAAFALTALPAATAARPAPRTVLTTRAPIQAFAADGARIAWISGSCRTVRVRRLSGGRAGVVGNARNTECDNRGTPVLALAGKRALWPNLTFGNVSYAFVMTGAVGERRPKKLQEVDHDTDGSGDYLTAVAGSGRLLAYSVLIMSGRTLANGTDVFFPSRGTVERVVGRKKVPQVGTTPPFTIAVGGGRVAVVPADEGENPTPRLRAALNGSVEIRDPKGNVVSRFAPAGRIRAIAVTKSFAVVLIAGRIDRYRLPTGTFAGSTTASGAAPELDAEGQTAIFRVGRLIRSLDLSTGQGRVVARAAARPIGLSIAGRSVAWAENIRLQGKLRGRVRAARLP